ncbi:WD40 repeat-like protein [Lichtheimia hyalospora FSU 10163]|nr:WD40 repeat-like protein [Lichtheimia hyalospora FSU 10163]
MHTTSSNTTLQAPLLPPATAILPTTPAHSSISQSESPSSSSSSFYPTMRYPLARATTPPSLLSYRSISTYQPPPHEGYKDHTSKRRGSMSTFVTTPMEDEDDASSSNNSNNHHGYLESNSKKRVKLETTTTTITTTTTTANNMPSPYLDDDEDGLPMVTSDALRQLPDMVHAYDSLAPSLQSYILFQLLKRSPTDTLQFVNALVTPVLKRDFLASLPLELALNVISYLDALTLCRAACVSHKWRTVVDSHPATWKRLLQRDRLLPSNMVDDDHLNEDPMDVDGEIIGGINRYKEIYRRQYTLRQNWRRGRARRIRFQGHPPRTVVTCLQFDDDKIISGADDHHIHVYNTRTGQLRHALTGHEGGVWALQYVGNTLVSGSTDRTVRVWDIAKGLCTHVFVGHTSTVRCLQIIQPTMVNGRLEPSVPLIVTGSRDTTLRVWRLPNLDEQINNDTYHGEGGPRWFMHSLTGHEHSVRALAAHGNRLVSGSYDCTVCVWNVEQGRMLHRMEGHVQKVYSVVIDPERQHCMSGSMDSTVRIWDMENGHCLKVLDGHTILVGLLGLTPKYLVSAAADASLRVWSPETGVCQHVLTGHHSAITCFQHNDEMVISGSEGGLKMWDINTGKHVCDLITNVSGVWRVAFDQRRCVATVHRDDVTSFEVLDFGVYGLEDT